MKIRFILPFASMTGGIRSVCEHSRWLLGAGHEVELLVPGRPAFGLGFPAVVAWKRYLQQRFGGRVRAGLRAYGLEHHVRWFDPRDTARLPEADATVATAWNTAEWLEGMPATAGQRYYFLQGYEVWDEAIRDRVERTWTLPFRRIVVAPWLERLAGEKFGVEIWGRVPSGVDLARFKPPSGRPPGPVTIGAPYEYGEWKGVDFGIEALWRIHEADPSIRFRLLGRLPLRHRVPPTTTYVPGVPERELAAAYGSVQVFLSPSLMEGFSLVTLEAMASGCALVATSVGAVPDMGVPTVDYAMVPPRDSRALADAALVLVREPERLADMGRRGRRLAERFSWARAAGAMLECLEAKAPVDPRVPWRLQG